MKIQVKKDVDRIEKDLAKLFFNELRKFTEDYHPDGVQEAKKEFQKKDNKWFGEIWTVPGNIWGVSNGLLDPEELDLKPTRKIQYLENDEMTKPKILTWNSEEEKSKFFADYFAQVAKVFQTIVGYGAAQLDVYSGDTKPLIIHVMVYDDSPTNIEDYSLVLAPAVEGEGF